MGRSWKSRRVGHSIVGVCFESLMLQTRVCSHAWVHSQHKIITDSDHIVRFVFIPYHISNTNTTCERGPGIKRCLANLAESLEWRMHVKGLWVMMNRRLKYTGQVHSPVYCYQNVSRFPTADNKSTCLILKGYDDDDDGDRLTVTQFLSLSAPGVVQSFSYLDDTHAGVLCRLQGAGHRQCHRHRQALTYFQMTKLNWKERKWMELDLLVILSFVEPTWVGIHIEETPRGYVFLFYCKSCWGCHWHADESHFWYGFMSTD